MVNLGSTEEPELWAVLDVDWQLHRAGDGLEAHESLLTLRLKRGSEEKYLKDQSAEFVQQVMQTAFTFKLEEV
jgi:hypothetical protein